MEEVVGQICLSESYIYPSVERFSTTFWSKLQYESEYNTSGQNSFPLGARATDRLLIIEASR
jgi:hypothetical protein